MCDSTFRLLEKRPSPSPLTIVVLYYMRRINVDLCLLVLVKFCEDSQL